MLESNLFCNYLKKQAIIYGEKEIEQELILFLI